MDLHVSEFIRANVQRANPFCARSAKDDLAIFQSSETVAKPKIDAG
jgi:hypothetical protein